MSRIIEFNIAKENQRERRIAALHELESKVDALDMDAALKYKAGIAGGDPGALKLLVIVAAAFRSNPRLLP